MSLQILPDGKYTAKTILSKDHHVARGDFYIELTYEITEPTHAGFHIKQKFNIINQNKKKEMIDYKKLSEFMAAIGANCLDEVYCLSGHEVILKIKTVTDSKYNDRIVFVNEIERVMSINE